MSLSLSTLMPDRWRKQWRATQRRLEVLEKRMQEADRLIDLLLSDERQEPAQDLGMHAQGQRREVVRDLFGRVPFASVVETGTYLGFTAGYLATQYGVPVHSCEIVPRYFHGARRRLAGIPGIHLRNLDSRSFLRELAADPVLTAQPTFFDLDAHWYKDLPLDDEVRIIHAAWKDYVILVDDFRVPGDDGYAWDDYGPGKVLDLDYLEPSRRDCGYSVFFPTAGSATETGQKVGYTVLASAACEPALASSGLLRRA